MAFRHGARRLELIPFEASTSKQIDLPRDRNIKRINLQFNGAVTLAGGNAGETTVGDSVLRLAPRIEIVADGVTTIFRCDARGLHFKNYLESQCIPQITSCVNGAAQAGTAISFNVDINLQNILGVRPDDTYLPAFKFRTLTLSVQWGALADMFAAANNHTKTIAAGAGIRPVVYESDYPLNKDIKMLRIQDYIDKQIATTQSEFVVDLPVGAKVYQALMLRTLDADVRESDIVNSFSIVTGEKFNHFSNIPFIQLQNENKLAHHLETTPAGIAYLYLLEDGLVPSGLAVNDVNTAKLVADVTVGGGTTMLRTYYDMITAL